MSRRNLQRSFEVEIVDFTKKGNGLGKSADENVRTAEVPFTLPGERVQACFHRKKNGVYAARLESILSVSPQRIEPRCVHFGVCGGCRWQNLSYSDQLKLKQDKISLLFSPLVPQNFHISHIVPCNPPWEYRNKMEFTFSGDVSGNRYLGLIMDGSKGKVLTLTECHLVNPWFILALKAVKAWWNESGLLPFHPHSNTGSLRTLIIREGQRTGDRLVMLTVSGRPEFALQKKHLESFTAFIRDAVESVDPECKLSIFLRIQQAVEGAETNFFEMLLYGPGYIREILHIKTTSADTAELAFDVSPSAFFQPNTRQSEKLYSLALQLLEIPYDSVVYDLYCGTGTLGICAAKRARQVVGIEISPESSLDARTNAAKNGLDNIKILTGSVRDVIPSMGKDPEIPLPDVVMIDPPRMGMDLPTIKLLENFKARKLLYISCNPSSQAENVAVLREMGYKITAIQPVDQFPHTVHIENIVILERT